jgi:hypothetical protein
MSANGCMRKSTRKRIQRNRDDARRNEARLEEAAVISGTKLPQDSYIARLRREIDADTTDEQRLKSMNELARVLWPRERAKQTMFDSPEVFDHDELHTAYHEGGHALLQMLFYRDLERVTIVPFFKTVEDFNTGTFVRGVCIDIPHDLSGCDEHAATVRSIEQAAIGVAAKIAEDLFCTCKLCAGSDVRDQEMLNEVFTDSIKAREGLASAVTALLRRHRPQLDAIANALFERKTLTGPEVFDVMVKSGWSPTTDCDPRAFYEDFGVPEGVIEQRLLARINSTTHGAAAA